jgi:hypothetical protein
VLKLLKLVSCRQITSGSCLDINNFSSLIFLWNPFRFHWNIYVFLFMMSRSWSCSIYSVLFYIVYWIEALSSGSIWNSKFDNFFIFILILRLFRVRCIFSITSNSSDTFVPIYLHKSWIFVFLSENFSIIYLKDLKLTVILELWLIRSAQGSNCSPRLS